MRTVTKKVIMCTLSTMMLICLSVLLIISNTLDAQAGTVGKYPQDAGIAINVSYSNSALTIQAEGGGEGLKYQFWIRTKVPVDTFTWLDDSEIEKNIENRQYIWKLEENFSTVSSIIIPVTPDSLDENGRYSVITRTMQGSVVTGEYYSSYTPQELGIPLISSVEFDGRQFKGETVIANQGQPLNINIKTKSNDVTFNIYSGEKLVSSNDTGIFQLSLLGFTEGEHKLTAEIVSENGIDSKDFKLYVYGIYEASERPVITSLKGESDDENSETPGFTTFVMQVKYADGSPILESDLNNFTFRLDTNGEKIFDYDRLVNAEDGTLDVFFNVTYGSYGIYRTQVYASRKGISSNDDTVIHYYKGFTREASLIQTSNAQIIGGVFTSSIDEATQIIVTASGSIEGVAEQDLRYAFYREDAAGWVMIRDYSSSESFIWSPMRPGKYVILARVKASGNATYEAESSRVYNITKTDIGLGGELSLSILDYKTKNPVDSLIAGRPYILNANYDGPESVLYMFTLSSQGLGTVYLNKYNPSNRFMFIPNKEDDYILNARVINTNSFGYMDISKPLSVSSDVQITWLQANGISVYGATTIPYDNTISLNAGIQSGTSAANIGETDVPYVAFNGNYGVGTFVEFDFSGKNLPQVAFFCDEVTKDITDGSKGMLITNGFVDFDGTSPLQVNDYNSLAVFGPNMVLSKDIRRGFSPDRLINRPGSAADPAVSISHGQLSDGVNYRYIVGFINENESLRLNILLINLDDGETVFTGNFSVRPIDGQYETGKIVAYSKINTETSFSVRLPVTGKTAASEVDLNGFNSNAPTTVNIIGQLNVSDFIDTSYGDSYTLKYAKSGGSKVAITGNTFNLPETGAYTLYYTVTKDGRSRLHTLNLNYNVGLQTVDQTTLNWLQQNNVTVYGANAILENNVISLNPGTRTGSSATNIGTTNVPYVAFDGIYGLGSFVEFYFTGKNMPQVAFFCDGVTSDITDGTAGIYMSNGFLNNSGTGALNSTEYTRYTVFGPNLLSKKDITDRLTDRSSSPIAHGQLVNGTNYRYVIGFILRFDSNLNVYRVRFSARVQNMDTGIEIYYDNVDLPTSITESMATGRIVAYSKINAPTTFSVSLPVTGKANAREV